MDPIIDQEAAAWRRRGYIEEPGAAGEVSLVKLRALSVPWLVFWALLGACPAVVYFLYSLLRSDDRVRLSVTPGGVLLVDREVSLINRLGPWLGALALFPLGVGIVLGLIVWFFGEGIFRPDARKVVQVPPAFALSGAPTFVPGTDAQGPSLRWEGTLTNKAAAAWPGAELVCRLKFRRDGGTTEQRESRSALAGGTSTWSLAPVPSPQAPWAQGEARSFRCETPSGKPVAGAQPESVTMDVIVPAPNGHFPWTSGPLPLVAPAAGR